MRIDDGRGLPVEKTQRVSAAAPAGAQIAEAGRSDRRGRRWRARGTGRHFRLSADADRTKHRAAVAGSVGRKPRRSLPCIETIRTPAFLPVQASLESQWSVVLPAGKAEAGIVGSVQNVREDRIALLYRISATVRRPGPVGPVRCSPLQIAQQTNGLLNHARTHKGFCNALDSMMLKIVEQVHRESRCLRIRPPLTDPIAKSRESDPLDLRTGDSSYSAASGSSGKDKG
jgi:hypothetical protein